MPVAGWLRGWVSAVALGAGAFVAAGGCAPGNSAAPVTRPAAAEHAVAAEPPRFAVHHALTVKDIPPDARRVRIWFCVPDDDDCQKVLDLNVPAAPAGYRLTRDPVNGHRYLYAEVDYAGAGRPTAAAGGQVSVATDFLIQRRAVRVDPDSDRVLPLTDAHRTLFAEYLRRDCPHMKVDDQVTKLADEVCGAERNVVVQARRLGQWVVDHSDHYSMPGAPKSSGQGDVKYCLANGGGGCTDQHGLFIALARARGIPTRLQFGTLLKPKNEGKDVDPGYRCWVQYFAPGYGWVPMDLSAADIDPARHDLYFSGLDDHRIRFVEGRDLDLAPKQDGPRLNLLTGAYVEVDGKPFKSFDRTLRFTEVSAAGDKPKPG